METYQPRRLTRMRPIASALHSLHELPIKEWRQLPHSSKPINPLQTKRICFI
jgi:hypothetical protein